MTRKPLATSFLLGAKQKTLDQSIINTPGPQGSSTRLSPWLSILLVIGLLLLSGVSYITWSWLHNASIAVGSKAAQQQTTTFNVQRTISYADLSITVLSAQYASSFSDDLIQAGSAIARLNMQVSNKTHAPIAVVYYDVARLLVPRQQPIAPTNVQLASSVQPGATTN